MGGFFGAVCKQDAIADVFFGTDYHSHLGTKRGGMAAYDVNIGLQREIHNIENSPFRTKFDDVFDEIKTCKRETISYIRLFLKAVKDELFRTIRVENRFIKISRPVYLTEKAYMMACS